MIRKAIIVVLTLGAVGMLAAHVSSQRTVRTFTVVSSRHATLGISTTRGRLWFAFLNYPEEEGPFWVWEVPIWQAFHYGKGDLGKPKAYWELSFPTWSAIASLATYPAITLVRGPLLRRRRRRKRGLCLRCGYSLEGNVTGVCPECGTGMQQ